MHCRGEYTEARVRLDRELDLKLETICFIHAGCVFIYCMYYRAPLEGTTTTLCALKKNKRGKSMHETGEGFMKSPGC